MPVSQNLFSLSEVLGLQKQLVVLVLDGRLFRLERAPMSSREPEFAELGGARRRVEAIGEVADLFPRALKAHTDAVEGFRARCLRLRPRPQVRVTKEMKARMALHDRLRFVVERLIPRLRKLSGAGSRGIDRSEALGDLRPMAAALDGLSSIEDTPKNLVEEVLGRDALLLGQNAYDVSWTAGDVRPRDCYLQVEGERYSVRKRNRRPLLALDAAFKEHLRTALRDRIFERENDRLLAQAQALEKDLSLVSETAKEHTTLYRDRERSVILGRNRTIFCCQDVPPFAMEDARRKLRLFDRVRVGVRLSSLDPEEVLSMEGAYVMECYDHAFVFHYGDLGRLCMGHDYAFFQRFWDMPLEEGIVEYLNAARLVICAGYYDEPGIEPYVPYGIEKHRRINLREARRRNLPIYRYYRT